MATVLKNLSEFNPNDIPGAGEKHFGIVVSEWNTPVTGNLLEGAVNTLREAGAKDSQLHIITVPGSFELPFGAQKLAERSDIDAVICLGCVIQGETRHFDFICDACAHGVTNVALKFNKPVIFGVLTTATLEQAVARSGGKHGNKGIEAAVTALKMVTL